MAFDPSSTAFVTAIVIPRSLKEPVGFKPSYLIYISTSLPMSLGILFNLMSGVFPSPRLIILVLLLTGSLSLYLSINPVYLISSYVLIKCFNRDYFNSPSNIVMCLYLINRFVHFFG